MRFDTLENPLLTTLVIVREIATAQGSMGTADLVDRFGLSERSVKRYIAEARHLGADLQSRRASGRYVWHVDNWEQIRSRLTTWMELEQSRTLLP